MTSPPIPDKPTLFCSYCQRHKPRALIVGSAWIRGGRQAKYRCRSCAERRQGTPRRGG
ncbi:MAG: hypothetical protein P9F75_07325 [Candidatus Contendobacter sp.]|nr:hypothetical protein [Candidatus Contendobacter sp.]